MSSLPSLGPRGEGWVAIQGILLAGIFVGGLAEASAVGGTRPWATVAGAVVLGAGILLALLGMRGLGRSLTPLPHPRDGSVLVETGVYGLVRHPIYGGLVIAALGYGLLLQALVTAVVGSLVLLAFFTLKSTREEVWLGDRYPGYAAYRARTRRMLPYLY